MKPFVLFCSVLLACLFMVPMGGAVLANVSDCQQGSGPTVTVGELTGADVTAEDFKKQLGLRIDATGDDSAAYTIASFSYVRAHPRTDLKTFGKITGPDFSAEVLQDLAKLEPGDVIYIEEILVNTPSGKVLKMPSLAFLLK